MEVNQWLIKGDRMGFYLVADGCLRGGDTRGLEYLPVLYLGFSLVRALWPGALTWILNGFSYPQVPCIGCRTARLSGQCPCIRVCGVSASVFRAER